MGWTVPERRHITSAGTVNRTTETRPVIAHVINTLEGGGTESMLQRLLCRFDHARFQHVIISMRHAGRLVTALPDEVACIALGLEGRSPFAAWRLARALRDCGANLVHARNLGTWLDTLLGTRMTGAETVLGFHGFEHAGSLSRSCRAGAWLARITRCRCTAVSLSAKNDLVSALRMPGDRIHVLGNGIDVEYLHQAAQSNRSIARARWGVSERDFVIGIVGSLTPVKDHRTLLLAFSDLIVRTNRFGAQAATLQASQHMTQWDAQTGGRTGIPEARLVIMGDGPERPQLQRLARELDLAGHVIFTGHVENASSSIGGFDAYVCSSRNEGLSNALLEAMAARRPVIATDVGGNAELLESGRWGRLVPVGDRHRLADALQDFLNDPEGNERRASWAAERAAHYDLAQAQERYERFYESCLRDGIPSPQQGRLGTPYRSSRADFQVAPVRPVTKSTEKSAVSRRRLP